LTIAKVEIEGGRGIEMPGWKDSTPHGQKRRAEDDLKSEQRLAKRFDLLNIGIVTLSMLFALCTSC